MKTDNRVAWTEGMFLRVQHFQQADRWTERLVLEATRLLTPYPWGVSSIEVDTAGLSIGRFGLTMVRATLPDGTTVLTPEQTDLPPPLELSPGVKDALVYLTLPARRPGAAAFAEPEHAKTIRYQRSSFEADDTNANSAFTAPIDIGRLKVGLKLSTEETEGFEKIALARIVEVRSDTSVILDQNFIAPCMNVAAQDALSSMIKELLGKLRHRATAISQRIGDPTIRGSAEVSDYLMLQILNRADPLIAHLVAQAAQMHPEAVYRSCAALAGELATFTSDDRRSSSFPAYAHHDLQASFAPVMDDLRRSLDSVLHQSAVLIPLNDRRHGVRVATLGDPDLRENASFVLAVRSEISGEELRRRLPNQIKVGSVDRIAELVNVALPGVNVRPMPVAPRQLPFVQGTVYFELQTEGQMWDQVQKSTALAIHVGENIPGINMELWGIRA